MDIMYFNLNIQLWTLAETFWIRISGINALSLQIMREGEIGSDFLES